MLMIQDLVSLPRRFGTNCMKIIKATQFFSYPPILILLD